jgi:hypothetical protein
VVGALRGALPAAAARTRPQAPPGYPAIDYRGGLFGLVGIVCCGRGIFVLLARPRRIPDLWVFGFVVVVVFALVPHFICHGARVPDCPTSRRTLSPCPIRLQRSSAGLMTPGMGSPLTFLEDIVRRPAWQRYGACRGEDVEAFVPSVGGNFNRARELCRSCTVRQGASASPWLTRISLACGPGRRRRKDAR